MHRCAYHRMFQSTRPYGARPNSQENLLHISCFNPHAPMGRDGIKAFTTSMMALFQSTRPYGARLGTVHIRVNNHDVSIHTPLWGATMQRLYFLFRMNRFNPHAPMGRDNCATDWYGCIRFQSTRPYGARLIHRPDILLSTDVSIHTPLWGATIFNADPEMAFESFNPHAPMGRDKNFSVSSPTIYSFNPHAPMGRDE